MVIFKSDSSLELTPYLLEDQTRFISFQTVEGTDLFPYLLLRRVIYLDLDEGEDEGQLEFIFDQHQVQVTGVHLKKLLPEIQKERLFSLRIGESLNPNHPRISLIEIQGLGCEILDSTHVDMEH